MNAEFDRTRFANLVESNKFLAAYELVQAGRLDRTDQAENIGAIAEAILRETKKYQAAEDRDHVNFLRAELSYILKDFPGLASLYRDQVRPVSFPGIAQPFQAIINEISDIFGGRKSVDESLKQHVDELRAKARESGLESEGFDDFAKAAEEGIRKGYDEFKGFLKDILGTSDRNGEPDRNGSGREEPKAGPDAAKTNEESIKVKIQDADDPLPRDLHNANPPEDSQKR